jgi:F420-non-reducing hydrogenase small subunit
MTERITIAVSWAAACGGCDVSLLDTEEHLLTLARMADIVYWPVAMDWKRDELAARPDGSVDVGLFNGAIRTSEQAEDARLFRQKCKVLVAYGSCACFGGIPGLGNLATREEILDVAYGTTASTENPDGTRPQVATAVDGHTLELPAVTEIVQSLPQLVPVDVLMPGCPPPTPRIIDLVGVVARLAAGDPPPRPGTVLAEEKALCDTCPRRATRAGGRMPVIHRPHEVAADPTQCFLDQGILCLGLATRGGCGATCIEANMPCRGCFGPTPDLLDPGAEALSAIGTLAGEANENDVPAHQMMKAVRSIRDPVGTFYRFTLPSAIVNRAMADRPRGKEQA